MSTLSETEAFIRSMRGLGAVRVCHGDVMVEFPGAPEQVPDAPIELVDAEAEKRARENLIYGSSD